MTRRPESRRRGATAVEAAVTLPLVFTLIFGMIVGGLGVFRYQMVATLAREGSRYASLHGASYASESGHAAATADDVYNNAIKPLLTTGMDPSKLTYAVSWSPDNTAPDSTVTVTVSYRWFPEVFLVGPYTLTSTSARPMAY